MIRRFWEVDFNEKLCKLRKSRGLTQEELAEALFVSWTAVSKWESGRGYPSIDSLKEISAYFSVTIDELLSGDELVSIAERENKTNIKSLCDLLFGIADIFYFILIVLPLYPKTVGEYVSAVNLFEYTQTTPFNLILYRIIIAAVMAIGFSKLVLSHFKISKGQKTLTDASIFLGISAALFFALTREAYATCIAFLLLIIKGALLLKYVKT